MEGPPGVGTGARVIQHREGDQERLFNVQDEDENEEPKAKPEADVEEDEQEL